MELNPDASKISSICSNTISDEIDTSLEQLYMYIDVNVVPSNQDGVKVLAHIEGENRDHNSKTIGTGNANRVLDTRVY